MDFTTRIYKDNSGLYAFNVKHNKDIITGVRATKKLAFEALTKAMKELKDCDLYYKGNCKHSCHSKHSIEEYYNSRERNRQDEEEMNF